MTWFCRILSLFTPEQRTYATSEFYIPSSRTEVYIFVCLSEHRGVSSSRFWPHLSIWCNYLQFLWKEDLPHDLGCAGPLFKNDNKSDTFNRISSYKRIQKLREKPHISHLKNCQVQFPTPRNVLETGIPNTKILLCGYVPIQPCYTHFRNKKQNVR